VSVRLSFVPSNEFVSIKLRQRPTSTLSTNAIEPAVTSTQILKIISPQSFDISAGSLSAALTADHAQDISLVLPPGATVDQLTVNGKPHAVTDMGARKQGCTLHLPKGKIVTVDVKFVTVCNLAAAPRHPSNRRAD